MFSGKNVLLGIGVLLSTTMCVAQPHPMTDPALDKPGEEWSYLAKSTTVIGMPFQPDVTQVTYDGALYTGHAELCFFYGDADKPLLARGKTFLNGWIPVVQYQWMEGEIAYTIEYFSSPLQDGDVSNTVNFVRLEMRNTGNSLAGGAVAAALRHSGEDNRKGRTRFDPSWDYEITENAVWRDGKLCYTFSGTPERESVPGEPYGGKFSGKTFFITPRAECGIVRYRKSLKPGESFSATFKMPRVPVAGESTDFLSGLGIADYDRHRKSIVDYWENLLQKAPVFELPEKRFQHAYRASLVHVLLATRNRDGKLMQTDGLPYPDFFLTSVPEIAMLYLSAGLDSLCKELLVPGAIAQQQENGLYYDRAVAHGVIIPATQGHILYSVAQTALFTQDTLFARSVYPSMQKAVEFIRTTTDTSAYGLLPRCWPYDAEMIDGHYTGQNMFALMGLRHAIRVARLLGEQEEAESWTTLANRYEASILRGIVASATPEGYVPTGLYDYITADKARKGIARYQSDADWENMILAWPTEMLHPGDPRVTGTLKRVRKDYAEGIMTYRHGLFLHQYITSNMIAQYLARGESYAALRDFYHQLLHSGSTHESFENLVKPWADRMVDPDCPPPHAWGTAKQGLMVRNFLLMEYGGKCGMQEGERELWMFHSLSPAWVKPGEKISFARAPTEFGQAGGTMSFTKKGAVVKFQNTFHSDPLHIRVRIPYFKAMRSFSTNAGQSRVEGDCILLSPDVTTLEIRWKDKPGAHLHTMENILTDYRSTNRFAGIDKDGAAIIETREPFIRPAEKTDVPQPLGFELVRQVFMHEYTRLAEEQLQSGRQPLRVEAPAMLSPAERKTRFNRLYSGR